MMNALGQSVVPITGPTPPFAQGAADFAASDEPGAANAIAFAAPAVPTGAIWLGIGVLAFMILRDFRSSSKRR